jgi:hypothetical protein
MLHNTSANQKVDLAIHLQEEEEEEKGCEGEI